MVTAHDLQYVNRVECKDNRDCLKCDIKELIERERNDRKEGEVELNTGLTRLESKMDEANSRQSGFMTALLVGVIVLIIQVFLGK